VTSSKLHNRKHESYINEPFKDLRQYNQWHIYSDIIAIVWLEITAP